MTLLYNELQIRISAGGVVRMKRLVVLMVLLLVGLWIYGKYGVPGSPQALSMPVNHTVSENLQNNSEK